MRLSSVFRHALSVIIVACCALLLPSIVALSLPLKVIERNLEEITINLDLYLAVAAAVASMWLLLLPIYVLAWSGRWTFTARLITVIGINVIAWGTLRPFFAVEETINTAVLVFIELAFFLIVLWMVRRLEIRSMMNFASVIAIAIAGTSVYEHINSIGPNNFINALATPKAADRYEGALSTLNRSSLHNTSSKIVTLPPTDLKDVRLETGDVISGEFKANSDGRFKIPFMITGPVAGETQVLAVKMRVDAGRVRVGSTTPGGKYVYNYSKDGERVLLPYVAVPSEVPVSEEILLPLKPGQTEGAVLVHFDPVTNFQKTLPARFEIRQVSLKTLGNDRTKTPATAKGNVYHILLDAFQGQLYPYVIDKLAEFPEADFQSFPNYRTPTDGTAFVNAFMFMGNNDYGKDWGTISWTYGTFQFGLMDTLWRNGVDVNVYPFYDYYCYRHAKQCRPTTHYRQSLLSQSANLFILDIVFLQILPPSLWRNLSNFHSDEKPMYWDFGFSISKLFIKQKQVSSTANLYTYDTFQQMLADEADRPANGQYVYSHVYIPHGPINRDENCAPYAASSGMPRPSVADHHVCALRMVRQLVDRLKSLGRYEEATIIVYSDHGSYGSPPTEDEMLPYFSDIDLEQWRREREAIPELRNERALPHNIIEGLTSGLMLVKYPGQSTNGTSAFPAQVQDIAPTILEHFDIARPDTLSGFPLQGHNEGMNRHQSAWFWSWRGKGRDWKRTITRHEKVDGKWRVVESVPGYY